MGSVKKKAGVSATGTMPPCRPSVQNCSEQRRPGTSRVTRSKGVLVHADPPTPSSGIPKPPTYGLRNRNCESSINQVDTAHKNIVQQKQRSKKVNTNTAHHVASIVDDGNAEPSFRVPLAAPKSHRTNLPNGVTPKDKPGGEEDLTFADGSVLAVTSTPLKRDDRALRIPLSPIQNVGKCGNELLNRIAESSEEGDQRWKAVRKLSRRALVLPYGGAGAGSDQIEKATSNRPVVKRSTRSQPLRPTCLPNEISDASSSFQLHSPLTYARTTADSTSWERSGGSGYADDEEYGDQSSSDGGRSTGSRSPTAMSPQLFDLREFIATEHERRFDRARARVFEFIGLGAGDVGDDDGDAASDESDGAGDAVPPKKKRVPAGAARKSRVQVQVQKKRTGADGYNRWIKKMVAEFEEIDNTPLCVSE